MDLDQPESYKINLSDKRSVLKDRQGLPLVFKEELSLIRIQQWYEHWSGLVYVSFSGGKDSTVLLHLVRRLYPDVPAVFSDTGLEYPEIRDFVKTISNVIWVKPKKKFKDVIEEYGYPVISKEVASCISLARMGNVKAINKLNGLESSVGYNCHYEKYKYLLDAPFKISDYCCYHIKKAPMKAYEKSSNRKAFVGIMAADSNLRLTEYLKSGCNSYSGSKAKSRPMGFWLESDIWEYIHKYNLPYSKIYDLGYKRTGCMFCMFGVHIEKSPNRFDLMRITHPKLYKFCMEKLKLKGVLSYIRLHQQHSLFEIGDYEKQKI